MTRKPPCVLVIEDDELVMEITVALLERLGYTVLSAATGEEAIEIVNGFAGDISSVLLDIRLPDLPGDEIYPHIRTARPDAKVYVCSGYPLNSRAQKIIDAGAVGFLQKPYTMEQLSQRLGGG